MENEFDDEVFEALLKAAVIQNSLRELETYPSEEELEKITISDACDRKIRRMIQKYWFQHRLVKGLKVTQRAASLIAMIMGVTFTVLLQFKEVRAACYQVFIQITEKYVQFDYTATERREHVQVNYIPDGYYETERVETDLDFSFIYQNSQGDQITIYYATEVSSNIDNEHYRITDITVNGTTGKYFAATDNRFQNVFVWYADNGYFLIEANLDQNELMKIAENIK